MLAATAACLRTSALQTDAGAQTPAQVDGSAGVVDGGTVAGAGDRDAGQTVRASCPPGAGPPADGGITWSPEFPAQVAPAQSTQWVQVSTASDCAGLDPGPIPPRLGWPGLPAPNHPPYCAAPRLDGRGNLSMTALADLPDGGVGVRDLAVFLAADGSYGTSLTDGDDEHRYGLAARNDGFVLLSGLLDPKRYCEYLRPLSASGKPGGPFLVLDVQDPDSVAGLIPNPAGGFVVIKLLEYAGVLQLRWVDDALVPLGDWHDIVQWKYNNDWSIWVDQKGRALVLSFIYPPSFGAPPPPSDWTFTARWADGDGPIGNAFEPIAPTYAAPNGTVLFATWGSVVSLPEGGFATFHESLPAGYGGTLGPTGWYALYPSGEARVTTGPPSWVNQFDGSLGVVAHGAAYAALEHDPQTCARTVDLISTTGVVCFKLAVEHSGSCDVHDGIDQSGSLVIQRGCTVDWWPLLVSPR